MFFLKSPIIILLILLLISSTVLAWSGFDQENNTTIEIGSGNLVREGLTITIFDWSTDTYHDVEILNFQDNILEVYDTETKQKRVFEMEE